MRKSMKKAMLLVMIAAVSVMMAAQIAKAAGIATSKHNLRSDASNTNTIKSNNVDEICVFCHTPHAGDTAAPLWNRTNPAGTSFTQYTSLTLTATVGKPAGVSLACLSCHDGVTAFDALINKPGSGAGTTPTFTGLTAGKMPAGVTNLGTDLTNDHPVSFTYDAALATSDGGLVSPASASLVVAGIPLYGSKVECASCHNVHDNANAPFLRVANAGSALCLKCHVK